MRLPALAVAIVLVAGCASPADEPPAPETSDRGDAAPGADRAGGTSDAAGGDAPAAGERPDYAVGRWWTWEVSSTTRAPTRVTTAVAEVGPDAYAVGLTDVSSLVLALTTHVVPMGAVARDDLSWDAHGAPVSLFDFPLADGKSWTTDLWFAQGVAVTATAADVLGPSGPEPGFAVVGLGPGESLQFRANWSSARGSLVSLDYHFGFAVPFDSLRLVEEGGGHVGTVHVPTVQSPLRVGISLGGTPPSPTGGAPGRATFSVGEGSTSVVFACFLGGAPGVYSAVATPPHGEAARCSKENPPTDVGFAEQTAVLPAVVGEWSVAYAAGGQGTTFVEAFVVTMAEATVG